MDIIKTNCAARGNQKNEKNGQLLIQLTEYILSLKKKERKIVRKKEEKEKINANV